jgi:hypothetical protein
MSILLEDLCYSLRLLARSLAFRGVLLLAS